MITVKDITHLRELIKQGEEEYCILLNFGIRSSKTIKIQKNGRFWIYNFIDDTLEHLTEKELWTKSNIGRAIDTGCFICKEEES